MAFREKNGRWRIRIRIKGRKAKSKTLPAGTTKEQLLELESKVRLGLIDPSLQNNSRLSFESLQRIWRKEFALSTTSRVTSSSVDRCFARI